MGRISRQFCSIHCASSSKPQRPPAADWAGFVAQGWRYYDIAISTQSGDRATLVAFAAGRRRVGVVTGDDPWLARILRHIALHRAVPAADRHQRVEQML